MMDDYNQQFETLTQAIDNNNGEIDELRRQLSEAQKQYFTLRVQNENLDGDVLALKANRDMQIGLNEERRLKQIKINIEDA
mmetsp:Transcript_9211/g.6981  ORF Transcript_9211/g.6981 Transcript_9211/m.6981 type:complete len:81 (+) Transcript_9211:738-980(+)